MNEEQTYEIFKKKLRNHPGVKRCIEQSGEDQFNNFLTLCTHKLHTRMTKENIEYAATVYGIVMMYGFDAGSQVGKKEGREAERSRLKEMLK